MATQKKQIKKPMVSIACVTYNHEKYISQALDSFFMQQTDFDYEIIVGDDKSTDSTMDAIESYQKKYPDKLKLLKSKQNSGSLENNMKVISSCSGKYIAFCDGDDYWTDTFKLQKQVDFLESNPDYVMVYSDISVVDSDSLKVENTEIYASQKKHYQSGNIFWSLYRNSFINTNTSCVRTGIIHSLLEQVKKNKRNKNFIYDYWMWLQVARKGKIKYIEEEMAAYRIHDFRISKKSYFEKRWPLVKLDIAFSLTRDEINSAKNKEFMHGILISAIFNRNIKINWKINAIKRILQYPPSGRFLLSKAKEKLILNQ